MQMWGERETRAMAGELQGEVRGGGGRDQWDQEMQTRLEAGRIDALLSQ